MNTSSTRRSFLKSSVALTAGLALAPGAGFAQQADKDLVVMVGLNVASFDPHRASSIANRTMARNLYDSLVAAEGTPPKLVPRLAQSWSISDDQLVYTFNLDPSARFNDGSPVTAEAVKYSLERFLSIPEGNRWAIEGTIAEGGIVAEDDHTLTITLEKPYAPFLEALVLFWVVNPALVEENKADDNAEAWFRNNAAGSGPFDVARFEPGNLVVLERVQDNWRPGGGNIGNVFWRITREPSTQRQLLQQGQGQMALGLTPEDMRILESDPNVKQVIEPEARGFHFKMNTARGPLQDVNLRRAICSAIDYDAMIDVVGADFAERMYGPFPNAQVPFMSEIEPWTTDMDRAREYLAQSEYADGGFTLNTVYLTGYEEMRRWSLILLDALRQLNIGLDISSATYSDIAARCRTPDTTPDFRPGYTAQIFYDLDPLAYRSYHSSTNGTFANPTYNDDTVDQLVTDARFETDPDTRMELYQEMVEKVMSDAPAIYGVWLKRRIAMRSNIDGYVYCPVNNSDAIEFFPLSVS